MINKGLTKLDLSKRDLTNASSELKRISTDKRLTITELDISCNLFEEMPQEVVTMQNLQSLDVRNNNFRNFEEVINGLSQLKQLTSLFIDVADSSQALHILKTLPHVQLLNGNSTKEEEAKEEEDIPDCLDLTDKELDGLSLPESNKTFIQLIQAFVSLKMNSNVNRDKGDRQIQIIFKQEINSLENYKGEIPNYLYAAKVVHSHNKTLKIMMNQIKEWENSPNSPEREAFLNGVIEDLLNANDLLIEVINYLSPRMDKIQEEYGSALKSLAEMEGMCSNEEELNALRKANESLHKQLEDSQAKYEARISCLEAENKLITERVFKKASTIIDSNERTIESKSNNDTISHTTRYAKHPVLTESNQKSTINKHTSRVYQTTEKAIQSHLQQTKKIALKTMKEVINEIYVSKAEYDKRCKESKLLKETMEQHMYTYLNKKYGLKSLIIEWAKNIIAGIKAYSSLDSTVCLFGRIMRNEQEESSRLDLVKLTESIDDIFEYLLKTKHPLKTHSEIRKLFKQKQQGILTEEEWKGIVVNLYEADEAKVIETKIASLIKSKNESTASTCMNGRLTREEQYYLYQKPVNSSITYSELTKVVLDYHIKFRDKQLKHFVELFKRCDKDNDGILNEEEFSELVASFGEYSEDELNETVFRFLAIVDPFNHQKVTFSDCIALFNSEMIVMNEGEEVSLLEKVCYKKEVINNQAD